MPRIFRTLGFWSWAATLAWSMRARARSGWPEMAGFRRRMLTIFSRPAVPSLAARYSGPQALHFVSSRRDHFPYFHSLGLLPSVRRAKADLRQTPGRVKKTA